MAYFLCAQATGLQGVHLPIRDATKLLDSQYANETTLYVQDDDIMLERVWLALDTFCYTTGAKINWHKSIRFLTDPSATSQWGGPLRLQVDPQGTDILIPWIPNGP